MKTVVLVLSLPPFFGVNVSLILAFRRWAWCFFRNACSALERVNFTVRVAPVAELVDLDALEAPLGAVRPLLVATSLPAEGTETWIVAVLPLTLWLFTVIAGLQPSTFTLGSCFNGAPPAWGMNSTGSLGLHCSVQRFS